MTHFQLNIEQGKYDTVSRWRRYSVLPRYWGGLLYKKSIGMGLSALLVAVSMFSLTASAKAWTGTLPACEVGDALNFSWRSAIKTIDPTYDLDTWTGSVVIATFDNDPVSTSFDLSVYVVATATFAETIGGLKSVTLDTGKVFNITKNPANSSYKKSIVTSSIVGSITTSSFACITTSSNANYPTAWTGVIYNSSIPQQEIACGTTDIQCKVAQGFQGITSEFGKVGQAIVNSIANIFIPNGDVIKAQFDSLTSFMYAKLGFLTYPLQWFVDTFSSFNDVTNNWCTDTSCSKTFGNIFGTPYTFDFYVVKTSLPTYWDNFLLIFRSITVGAVLYEVYAVLKRTLKS